MLTPVTRIRVNPPRSNVTWRNVIVRHVTDFLLSGNASLSTASRFSFVRGFSRVLNVMKSCRLLLIKRIKSFPLSSHLRFSNRINEEILVHFPSPPTWSCSVQVATRRRIGAHTLEQAPRGTRTLLIRLRTANWEFYISKQKKEE